jgi:predicted GH43/DUF377 family glycosyl hydrolase
MLNLKVSKNKGLSSFPKEVFVAYFSFFKLDYVILKKNKKLYISLVYEFKLGPTALKEIKVFNDKIDINNIIEGSFRFAHKKSTLIISLSFKDNSGTYTSIYSTGIKLFEWQKITTIPHAVNFTILADEVPRKNYIAYYGEDEIYYSESNTAVNWNNSKVPIISKRDIYFDYGQLHILGTTLVDEGILVVYSNIVQEHNRKILNVGYCILAKSNPQFVMTRSDYPLWFTELDKESDYTFLGITFKDKIRIYFNDTSRKIIEVEVAYPFSKFRKKVQEQHKPQLTKVEINPTLTPSNNDWESVAVFNPAAILDDNKVHLFYRAHGHDGISVIGYAVSNDGINFDQRFDTPVYIPTEEFETSQIVDKKSVYTSGGNGMGCEDPRVTMIDDKLYMIYAAFNGYEQARLAMTTLNYDDFKKQNWEWSKAHLMSPRPTVWGTGNKSGALFPEKINGKYVILHRIWPNISIDYVDDMDFSNEDKWLEEKGKIPPRQGMWDSAKIGAGAPPLKTKDGWLLIYQSVGKQDSGKYKIGAMLLDLEDPSKILYRSQHPVLEPNEWYENEGLKGGVAYPCGAVIKDDKLFVYYGAADTVVCVAHADLETFLEELKTQKPIGAEVREVRL